MKRAKVILVGAHVSSGYSMKRYTEHLRGLYERLQFDVCVWRPPRLLARVARPGSGVAKWLNYADKWILGPPMLFWKSGGFGRVHIADQADAAYRFAVRPLVSVVVTVHDLTAIEAALGRIPHVRVGLPGRIYQAAQRIALEHATGLICVSIDGERHVRAVVQTPTHVVPNFLDDAFASQLIFDGQSKSGFLIVANPTWHKRRNVAISWFVDLCSIEQFREFGVTVVGAPLTSAEWHLVPEHLRSRVRQVRAVSDSELRELYAAHAVLLVASEFEGFAWPLIEANAQGTIALCADIPILRETGGNANVFAPARSLGDVAWDVAGAISAIRSDQAKSNAARYSRSVSEQALARVWSQITW